MLSFFVPDLGVHLLDLLELHADAVHLRRGHAGKLVPKLAPGLGAPTLTLAGPFSAKISRTADIFEKKMAEERNTG